VGTTPDLSELHALGGDPACIFRTSHTAVLDGSGQQVAWNDHYSNFGHNLKRPEIETPDTIFLELRGGMEWQWRPKTAFFVDVGFTWAAEEISIRVDDREQFGDGVTPGLFEESDVPSPRGGAPAYVTVGGLVLRGFDGELQPQPGEYIITGGKLDYGGWKFAMGVRLTL